MAEIAQPRAGLTARTSTSPVGERVARRMEMGEMLARRWGGCWIDLIVLAVLFFVPGLLFQGQTWAITLGGLVALAYFPVTEGRWGRSLGKLVTRTIVVNRNGDIPGIGRILVRTVFRLFEVNPFLLGGIPAAIFVMATPTRQRLGDLVAGTYVVTYEDLKLARSKVEVAVFD